MLYDVRPSQIVLGLRVLETEDNLGVQGNGFRVL